MSGARRPGAGIPRPDGRGPAAGRSWPLRRRRARGAAVLGFGLALGLVGPTPGAAQVEVEPARGPVPGEALQEPEMAEAPKQFRVAVTGGALSWAEEPRRGSLDDGALVGLDVERRVAGYLGFRLSGGYGRTTAANDTTSADLNQYVADVVAALRLAVAPLRQAGVVPFGTIGLGTVVHDPESAGLVTKSQSAVAFGAGLDADLAGAFGIRVEWRRYIVDGEDLFDPTDRTGVGRVADRFHGGLFLKL